MRLAPFTFSGIPRILFGEGLFDELPDIIASFGHSALLVTGTHSFRKSDKWQTLTEALVAAGIRWESAVVEGEPSPELVDSVVGEYHGRGIDVVVGIGGGSVIDAAKAIAGLLPFGNSVMDHLEVVGRGIPYSGPATPLIAVPTTAGTGTEATKNAVLSVSGERGFKRSFRHDSLMPNVALVDPTLTYTCPPALTAASGMDALTQLLESCVSTGANAFTDPLALSGLAAVKDGLIPAYNNDPTGRALMSYAALNSGICLAYAGLGIIHGLASPLGAFFPIPHGAACAATLVAGTTANMFALRERDPGSLALRKYAQAGRLLTGECFDTDEGACDALLSLLSDWKQRLNIPGLSAYGIRESDFPRVAADCRAKTNPVELSEDEILGILKQSL